MSKQWTIEEIDFLKKNYETMQTYEIANNLHRTKDAVKIKARKIGLKKPEKYYYNHDFFENIDTEEKAYWLGFIYADGYITQSKTNAELGIEIQKGDFKHLQKLNCCIDGNVEVTFRDRIEKRAGMNSNGVCSIRLYSKKVVNDLINNGVKFRKSDIIEFPNFSDKEIMKAFIRGFFDGDGCIMFDKRKKCLSANFTSASLSFIQDLRSWLYDELNVSSYISIEKPKKGIINSIKYCYRLYIKGMENSYIFCSAMYQDAKIYLDRKYELFFHIVNNYDIVKRIEKNNQTNRKKHLDCLSK